MLSDGVSGLVSQLAHDEDAPHLLFSRQLSRLSIFPTNDVRIPSVGLVMFSVPQLWGTTIPRLIGVIGGPNKLSPTIEDLK